MGLDVMTGSSLSIFERDDPEGAKAFRDVFESVNEVLAEAGQARQSPSLNLVTQQVTRLVSERSAAQRLTGGVPAPICAPSRIASSKAHLNAGVHHRMEARPPVRPDQGCSPATPEVC